MDDQHGDRRRSQRQVRFRLRTYDLANNPLALISSGSVPGLLGSAGAVLNVGLASGFKANLAAEAFSGGSWIGVDTLFNSLQTNCTNCVIKGTNAGFWYEQVEAVPEPTSMALLGAGLVFGARRLRRRRSL